MKNFLISLIIILSLSSAKLYAQEIDTIPINTKDLNIKLKRSPLPSRTLPLQFEPVKLRPAIVNAKVNYWKTKTAIGININQAQFSDNWKGGGVNSIAVGGLLNWKAEYSKNSYSYVSEVILQYGKIKNKDQLQKKTNDRIFWDNKASFQLSKNWYFFGSVNFESQFDNGYSYATVNGTETATLISKFMGPGYLTESVGFEYKPNKYFSTRIGTGTARQTFVLDTALYRTNPKNYGVTPGKQFRNELAFQIVAAFDKDIFTNTNLKARYAMFIPYEDIAVKRVDHRLDVALTAKINRYMNTSLTGVLLYDMDTGTNKVQASQTLALGFAFVFPR
ncbi:DUF3078 domain-containing protein [Pedobacter sp. Leaf194]|uniref:DUF3078 domain-containing protein n=1 Tax=Pedobacter sp. Leaf194 TaxID=1736297 RepID=UPI000703C0B9|nr:DUF3078 domain-containing protein [Pedobacter sp. Leaf194]KQS41024.1 hypothetical protein ASG14_00615 [Pedobacter sp. Leaf194]RYD77278.1 MAG: DUF3078 domain-containing protein [Sphingobacteriales bacterium]